MARMKSLAFSTPPTSRNVQGTRENSRAAFFFTSCAFWDMITSALIAPCRAIERATALVNSNAVRPRPARASLSTSSSATSTPLASALARAMASSAFSSGRSWSRMTTYLAISAGALVPTGATMTSRCPPALQVRTPSRSAWITWGFFHTKWKWTAMSTVAPALSDSALSAVSGSLRVLPPRPAAQSS